IDRVAQQRGMGTGETYLKNNTERAEATYDRVMARYKNMPLTAEETARVGRLEGDLKRATDLLSTDSKGALKTLEGASKEGHWSGLKVNEGRSSVIGRSSMDSMWTDLQRYNLSDKQMAEMAYLHGRDEVGHRVDRGMASYSGKGGTIDATK